MKETIPERFGIKPHAYRSRANRQIALGAVLLVGTAWLTSVGHPGVAALPGLVGVFLLWVGGTLRREGAVVQILNRALHAVTVGDVEGAELLHRAAERDHRLRSSRRRSLAMQRALLAIRVGGLATALEHIEAALVLPMSWLSRSEEGLQRISALAIRAFLRAARGDAELAKEDIDAVRAAEHKTPDALARVALAEAVTLQRRGQRAALREHLRVHRTLLASHTNGRERLLVRGLERMLASQPDSVYRTPAEVDTAVPDGWLSEIAPGVASFVPARDPGPPIPDVRVDGAQTDDARKRLHALPRKAAGVAWKTLALWVLLIVMLFAIFQLMGHASLSPTTRTASSSAFDLSEIAAVGAALIALALFVIYVRKNARDALRLWAGQVQRAVGDVAGARATFTALRRGAAMTAASAEQQLAAMALHDGDEPQARALVEEAIGRFTEPLRALSSDFLYPSLIEDRAVLTASAGDVDEAAAELRMLREEYSSYPFMERAVRRVTLMIAVQSDDYETAAHIADASVDITFSAREDLLIDVASAVVGATNRTPGEIDRLQDLLAPPSDEREWLEAVAPDLLDAFDGAVRDDERE
ncbi:MAG: hypothetical protein AB7S26_19085 [Sandaracinaceae bacterium]